MISLRKANIHDLSLLKFWDEQPHVISSDPNDDWDWENELTHEPEWREQLIAEIDGKPMGFIQIIDPAKEESHYWGDIGENKRAVDIWIGPPEYLGKGYGTEMMSLALDRCFSDQKVTEVLIDPLESNTRAIEFYKKVGFRFLEKRTFGTDECIVLSIAREDWISKDIRERS